MAEGITTTSLKHTLAFPFRHPQWLTRFLIGAGLMLGSFIVPVVPGLFVSGYALRAMRQAIRGEALTLPEWNDWGRLLKEGFYLWVISLVYLLPGSIVLLGGLGFYFIVLFAGPFLAAAGPQSEFPTAFLGLFFVALVVLFVALPLGMLLFLLGAILLPPAMAHYAAREQLGAAFRLREWWPLLRRNKMGYLVAWVVVAGLMVLLSTGLTVIYYTVCLAWTVPFLTVPLSFYLELVAMALFGQAYRESATLLEAGR